MRLERGIATRHGVLFLVNLGGGGAAKGRWGAAWFVMVRLNLAWLDWGWSDPSTCRVGTDVLGLP